MRDRSGVNSGTARTLIVFARAPQLGRVKTRLAERIGRVAALDVYRQLLLGTLKTAAICQVERRVLCIDGDDPDAECARLAQDFGMVLTDQRGCDLGERMFAALQAELAAARLPVLVGCDLPALHAHHVEAAHRSLSSNDAVFSPTEDGGYGLVGLSRPIGAVFREITWGGGQVMDATRDRLRALGCRWQELDLLWDVDREIDYRRWLEFRQRPGHAPDLVSPSSPRQTSAGH